MLKPINMFKPNKDDKRPETNRKWANNDNDNKRTASRSETQKQIDMLRPTRGVNKTITSTEIVRSSKAQICC